MSADRDITQVVLTSFTSRLRRGGDPPIVARDLIGIAKAHGVRFTVPAHWHDPNADHRLPVEPGDPQAGVAAALAALGKGVCEACGGRVDLTDTGRIAPHEISDKPPHPPYRPCPGGQPQRTPNLSDPAHNPIDQEQHRD